MPGALVLVILGITATAFFGLGERGRALVADPRIDTVVLDFEVINFIDSQGSNTVSESHELAAHYGAQLRLARVKPEV